MHEMSVVENILKIVLESAEKNKAKKINRINLIVGALADIVPQWTQFYFDMMSRNTIAEKAILNIEKIPAKTKCLSCSYEYIQEAGNFTLLCPKCRSEKTEIISGREFKVSSIEIDV